MNGRKRVREVVFAHRPILVATVVCAEKPNASNRSLVTLVAVVPIVIDTCSSPRASISNQLVVSNCTLGTIVARIGSTESKAKGKLQLLIDKQINKCKFIFAPSKVPLDNHGFRCLASNVFPIRDNCPTE